MSPARTSPHDLTAPTHHCIADRTRLHFVRRHQCQGTHHFIIVPLQGMVVGSQVSRNKPWVELLQITYTAACSHTHTRTHTQFPLHVNLMMLRCSCPVATKKLGPLRLAPPLIDQARECARCRRGEEMIGVRN